MKYVGSFFIVMPVFSLWLYSFGFIEPVSGGGYYIAGCITVMLGSIVLSFQE